MNCWIELDFLLLLLFRCRLNEAGFISIRWNRSTLSKWYRKLFSFTIKFHVISSHFISTAQNISEWRWTRFVCQLKMRNVSSSSSRHSTNETDSVKFFYSRFSVCLVIHYEFKIDSLGFKWIVSTAIYHFNNFSFFFHVFYLVKFVFTNTTCKWNWIATIRSLEWIDDMDDLAQSIKSVEAV